MKASPLDVPESLSFAQMFQQFYDERRTGTFTVHLLHGTPVAVDLPSEPLRIVLDNGKKNA